MPKFLDTPSWYDSNGTILSAEGRYVINLTTEDFDTQSETGMARATIDISNLPYGTKGVIYSPFAQLATMQYIDIIALSNQTTDLEIAYSVSTLPYVPYGIFFTISHQMVDMNGKTIIFENATVNKHEANSLVRLQPSIFPNVVEVIANGTTKTIFPMPTGVGITYFNGNSSIYSNVSFYAPTTSGTSGQYLQSNGSGSAPTWADIEEPNTTKYLHTIRVESTSTSNAFNHFSFSIPTTTSAQFTLIPLIQWLARHGFSSITTWYPASGYMLLTNSLSWDYIQRVYGVYPASSHIVACCINGDGNEVYNPITSFVDTVVEF